MGLTIVLYKFGVRVCDRVMVGVSVRVGFKNMDWVRVGFGVLGVSDSVGVMGKI